MSGVNKYTTIFLQGLPGVFSTSYIDKRYTTNEPIAIGYESVQIKTEGMYALPSDSFVRQRDIQTILYQKYKMQLPYKMHDWLDLIKFAETVTILTKDGVSHRAIITSLSSDYIDGSFDRFMNIEYYDADPYNYKNFAQSISSFLRSDYLISANDASTLYELEFQTYLTGQTWKVYTNLVPFYNNAEIDLKKDKVNGVEYPTRYINADQCNLRFYLNEVQTKELLSIYNICFNTGGSYGYTKLNRPSLSTLTAIEVLTVDARKIDVGIDLYELNIIMKHSKNEYNPYV